MKIIKVHFFLTMILLVGPAVSQELMEMDGPKLIQRSAQLPEDLTSSRTAIIIAMDHQTGNFITRSDWGPLAQQVHTNLRKMSIDGIWYVHYDDLTAGPEAKSAFVQALKQRKVKNLIVVNQQMVGIQDIYSLKVTRFTEDNRLIEENATVWMEEHEDLNRIFIRLGRQVLQQNLPRTNFLIPEAPFLVQDITLFPGMHLTNYPGLLRRATLGVVTPEKIPIPDVNDEVLIASIEKFNQGIDAQIQEMEAILTNYPYKYEFIQYGDDEALYKKGFQFVMMPLNTTGKSIKKMLNYKITGAETAYISIVPRQGESGVQLKTIPVDAMVHKYYIKQTIAHDVHVGSQWDSDLNWQAALQNFILNMKEALK